MTYFFNDVIVLKGGDVAVLEDETLDELESDEAPGSRDVLIAGDTARLIVNKITVTNRRKKKKNLLESLDFEVVSEERCDTEEKPVGVKTCTKRICPTRYCQGI